MNTPVCTFTVSVPPPDYRQIRRYAGCPEGAQEIIDECIRELAGLQYRVSYREFDIHETQHNLDLGFAVTDSCDLKKALHGCSRVLLFAATVGILPDRLIARYSRSAAAKALFIQAIGTERVEALCDAFCKQQAQAYAAGGHCLLPRFSPGYGDLPLSMQRQVFDALNCPVQLGIALNDSLLMTPSKSVTALAGIR